MSPMLSHSLDEWLTFETPGTIDFDVRYDLRTIILGPYQSPKEYEEHLATTIGAGDVLFDTQDELRFSATTMLLESARILVPEHPVPAEELLRQVAHQVATPVRPSMTNAPRTLQGSDAVWIDDDGNTLLAFAGDTGGRAIRHVQISKDFELWLGDGIQAWILRRPAEHLSVGWLPSPPGTPDPELGRLLAQYIRLLSPETLDAIADGSQEEARQFRRIHSKALPLTATDHALVLTRAIEDLADNFDFSL